MKLVIAASLLYSVAAFAPSRQSSFSTHLQSTLDAPERTAPDAGYTPEWEDREGLAPEEFIKSNMGKPDLAGMWECPLTRWDSEG